MNERELVVRLRHQRELIHGVQRHDVRDDDELLVLQIVRRNIRIDAAGVNQLDNLTLRLIALALLVDATDGRVVGIQQHTDIHGLAVTLDLHGSVCSKCLQCAFGHRLVENRSHGVLALLAFLLRLLCVHLRVRDSVGRLILVEQSHTTSFPFLQSAVSYIALRALSTQEP